MPAKAQQDHFIPATYLRRFTSEGRVFVYRKRTARLTPEKPENICRARNGDLNRYFRDPTALRQFLSTLENEWPTAASNIEREVAGEANTSSAADFFIVAGIIAYIRSCCPTAVRLLVSMEERRILDVLPYAIEAMIRESNDPDATRSLSRQIMEQGVRADIDGDHPRAVALQQLRHLHLAILAGSWLIMPRADERPYITSDYPACISYLTDQAPHGPLYFPLTPNCAVFIKNIRPNRGATDNQPILGSVDFGTRRPTVEMADQFNTLIAKCADDVLVSSENGHWFETLDADYRNWSMQCLFDEVNGQAVGARFRAQMTPNRWG